MERIKTLKAFLFSAGVGTQYSIGENTEYNRNIIKAYKVNTKSNVVSICNLLNESQQDYIAQANI